jgi:uncharacterized membrane protein
MTKRILIVATLFLFLLMSVGKAKAQSEPVVRAVLFYSPTCPHCEYVITQTLPPLAQKYGDQLQIIGVNVSEQEGGTLFLAALDQFKLQEGGVPFLVVGENYLIGSDDIPEKFPDLIETYLIQGGVDWPDIPGLREAMAVAEVPTQQSEPTAVPTVPEDIVQEPVSPAITLPETSVQLTWQEKFAQDPTGNALSVIVLAAMVGTVIWTGTQFQRKTPTGVSKSAWDWLIPVVCIVGFGVAGYLAYVETRQISAVCGPVGDCNTVQQSEYARLFGILPIGVMGLAGYVAIMIAWLVARYTTGKIIDIANLSMFGMAVFGVLFSIYLTFLEPFVIGATCAWCLTSAILITLLMLLTVRPAKLAFIKNPFGTAFRRRHEQVGERDD